MWLLIKNDPPEGYLSYCVILSETHPSVERQEVLCGWVADSAPCAGWLLSDGTWSCDAQRYRLAQMETLINAWDRHNQRMR